MKIKRFFESITRRPTIVIEEVDDDGILEHGVVNEIKICISDENETNYARNRMFELGDEKSFENDQEIRDRWLLNFGKFRDFEFFDEDIHDNDECWVTIEYLDDFPETIRAYKNESEAKDYMRHKINGNYFKIFLNVSDAISAWNEHNTDKRYIRRTIYSEKEIELNPEIKKILTQRRFDL